VWHAPRLIGLAYAFQEVASIGAAAHDVLMDAVVTEEGFTRCTTG
jgi:5-formyltetrahydrofolate cyclo-ligase